MKRHLTVMCIVVLSGCARLNVQTPLSADRPVVEETRTSDGRNVTAKSGDAMLLDVLRLGYETCLPKAKPGVASAKPVACTDQHVEAFLNAGLTLSESFCDDFFRNANQSARKRQYARGAFNDVGGGIQAILGLAKVTTGVVSGIGAGVSLIDSTFRNYDSSFMVDADLAKLRRLVLAAQDSMRLSMERDKTSTIYSAERRIIRYAGLCTFLGMKGLLDDSLAAKTKAIEDENADKGGPGAQNTVVTTVESTVPVPVPPAGSSPVGPPAVGVVPPQAPDTTITTTVGTVTPLSPPPPPN